MKALKGTITNWYRVYFDVEAHRHIIPEETLGYVIYGHRNGRTNMRTSPVIYFDEYTNEIETLNSRYLLVGDGFNERVSQIRRV